MEYSSKKSSNCNGALQIENLTFCYPSRDEPVLRGLNLSINAGEFVVLCGKSGCGKTTLLRHLKPTLSPHGVISGELIFEGKALAKLSQRDMASKIGFVLQNPDNQIVTDKVWHELAFGLESLGYDTPTIRLRVAEMASFFGIQAWFYKNVAELSGGQKQLLALASIMAMQPSLLILDEPTSQLDPIAASDFLAAVGKINRELGVTVILTEHRLEEAFSLASRVIVMEDGTVLCDGTPSQVGEAICSRRNGMFLAMPVPMRVWAAVSSHLSCPVTVRDGREWLSEMEIKKEISPKPKSLERGGLAIELEDIWFKYEKDLPDVLKGLSFHAHFGELTAILGGNGTGKTSAISIICGLNTAYRGKVKIDGTQIDKIPVSQRFDKLLGVLPQNPQALFSAKTVREDLGEILRERGLSKQEKAEKLQNICSVCELHDLLDYHPYDLSGGEQQRAALAKVLLLEPKILLLDEPTKGLDAEFKMTFSAILKRLTNAGAAVVMVSHDVEFCAEYSDKCALFFDGSIVAENSPQDFFCHNSFYTTAANRMSRGILPNAVTANDVIFALGGNSPSPPDLSDKCIEYRISSDIPDITRPPAAEKKLTPLRIGALCLSTVAFILTVIMTVLNWSGFSAFISGGTTAIEEAGNSNSVWLYTSLMMAFGIEAVCITAAFSWKMEKGEQSIGIFQSSRKLSKRSAAAAVMILLAIPLTIYVGIYFFGDRKYYFISLLIILEAILPFALIFERRSPQARELVIISVMCAIGVSGRVAFFMLPQFKPVTAVVIIAGVAFGGEAGFLVGAVTAFVSNMFFGQGPLTPWQMFAFGVIGFLAGVLFRKGILIRKKASLCIFGGLATFIIYGGIMNPASMLTSQPSPTWKMLWLYYLQGIPFDLVHSLATMVFLYIAGMPMLEKLDRLKIKYGLVE